MLRAVVTISKNKIAINVRFCIFVGNRLYNVVAKFHKFLLSSFKIIKQ